MVTILPFDLSSKSLRPTPIRDKIWAVVALVGPKRRVASIHSSRPAAVSDCLWRREQVKAYARFLADALEPAPVYHIALIHRGELPKGWSPMPALGVLQGRFI
ncbi:hypothetical protein [Acetobacter sp.]|uniref:hypothetical protein n=1 Tax=Acetobacter sp. TaxID=440 RepID=UPI0039E755B3